MSPSRPFRLLRGFARATLLWLLAAVVPLQCGAALSRAAAGPLHTHVAVAASAPELELSDFRRVGQGPSAEASQTSPLAALLHGHKHATAQRHHHVRGDAGVVMAGDSGLDPLDDGTGTSSGAFADLLPLLATPVAWRAPSTRHLLLDASPWAVSMHVGSPLERPPRGDRL